MNIFPRSPFTNLKRKGKVSGTARNIATSRIKPAIKKRLGIHFLILFSFLSKYLEAIAARKMKTFHMFKAIKYLKVSLYAPIAIAKIIIGPKKLMALPNSAKRPSTKTRYFFIFSPHLTSILPQRFRETKKDSRSYLDPMRREGLEPSRPKAVTGSLVLRVCQFRHPRD